MDDPVKKQTFHTQKNKKRTATRHSAFPACAPVQAIK